MSILRIQLKSYLDFRLWVKFQTQNEPRIWELPVKLSIRLMGIVRGILLGDDLPLVLQGEDGLVLIMGCSHAGLLNTCVHATRLFNSKIKALIGGTHVLEYTPEDVKHVGDVLENTYGAP